MPRPILYIQHTADLYGASRALLNLLGALDRSAYTPLVALPGPGPLAEHLRALDVPVIAAPYLQTLWGHIFRSWRVLPFAARQLPAALALRRAIRQHEIALVHSNVWTVLTGAFGARAAGVPHLWHVREVLPRMGGMKAGLVQLTLRNAARVVCISEAVAEQFAGHRSEHVRVIYDGLPLGPARPPEPPHSPLRVGLVGRLHPQKGQADLLHAFAMLPADLRAKSRILLVGGASHGQEAQPAALAALAERLGIAGQVELCGFVAQPESLIRSLDLLVLPATRAEGLGGVLLEAMAAQVPVLASAVGGIREIVADGENGVLVPPQQPAALAAALERLLRDPQECARLAQAGRATVEQRFSARAMAAQIEGVYRELLGAPYAHMS
jgi:glycosyltransferase involved in cell wall biosynthesis